MKKLLSKIKSVFYKEEIVWVPATKLMSWPRFLFLMGIHKIKGLFKSTKTK